MMNWAACSAIITATVAVAVAVITYGQWVTNRARLRHELFERRYELFEKIARFLAGVMQRGRVELNEDTEFLRQTKQAYFVFGCDPIIKKLVDDIYRNALELHALEATKKDLQGDALGAHIDKERQVKDWFSMTLSSLEATFGRYLRLDH